MLLFSTILEINNLMTEEDFIQLTIEWNQGSPHSENVIQGMNWKDERSIRYSTDSLWLVIGEYRSQNIIAIRYEKIERDGVVWDTDYVTNFNDMKMSIHLDRSYLEMILAVNPSSSTPYFITLLIEKGCLKSDEDMLISRGPVAISEDNIETLTNVVNGRKEYHLPAVYISRTYYDGEPINIQRIVGRLKGVAYVLVEKSLQLNNRIRELCDSKNEYCGAIGIYYPSPAIGHRRYLYHEYEGSDIILLEKVIRNVIQYSNSQLVDTLHT